jgi:hypothetical protein
MHTYAYDENIVFLHNGDFSGEVRIQFVGTGITVKIPMEALKGFIGEYVRHYKVYKLENCETDELLFGRG